MCAMWLLLQLVVALLYWDLPPAESSELQTVVRQKQRDDEEEEEPLMGADELEDTYGAVIVDPQQSETQLSSERLSPSPSPPPPGLPPAETLHPPPDPFEDFSAKKGRLEGSSLRLFSGNERVVFYLFRCWF